MSTWRGASLLCRGLVGVAAVASGGGAGAAPETYALDAAATHVHFEIVHFGTSTLRGRFDTIEGSITLDRSTHGGNVSVAVDIASVSTGTPIFNGVLRGPYLLAAQAHPKAYFVARQFVFEGERLAALTGTLTLRGVDRALTLRALRFGCRPAEAPARETCGGDFEGELTRSDFGITHSLPFVADTVRLVVQVEGTR